MLWVCKAHLHHTKENPVKFNSGFYKKMDLIATPTSRRAVADLAKKTAHWGIKGQGDLPMIMGVLEFGDPDHRFLNNKGGVLAPIPPRPWLRKSAQGTYRSHLVKYVNDNLPKVLRGFPKSGQNIVNSDAQMTTKEFIQGLAEVGAKNARAGWDTANFTPNAPATLANKSDPRPLHGNGKTGMSADAIEAWSE